MSSTIDQKIVEMKFDNRDFERNAKTSMSTLDKLKEKLNFKSASKGLEDLQNASNQLNFSETINGINRVIPQFNAFYSIANRIFERLTDKAINLVKSMSVDQVTAGMSKYEELTASVQTIMAATGKDIDDVTEQVERLSWFSDETSYSFTDMINNVGKFTSAGVELESAVTAMEGIANWAAISGQNATTASRAMYNLAQSLGSGYVALKDWMSIENANMATKEFKENALDAAAAVGTLVKVADGQYILKSQEKAYKKLNKQAKNNFKGLITYQNFRESLQYKWLDTTALNRVLTQYGAFGEAVKSIQESLGLDTASGTIRVIENAFSKNNFGKTDKDIQKIAEDLKISNDEAKALAETYNSVGRSAFKAAQEAKTWTDVVGSVKDAVSSQFMNIFQSIFGDYQDAKVLFTDMANELWEVFAGPLSNFSESLDDALYHKNSWDNFTDTLDRLGISTEDYQNKLIEKTRHVTFEIGEETYTLEQLIEKYGSLEKVTERGYLTAEQLTSAVRSFGPKANAAVKEFMPLPRIIEEISEKGGRIKLIESLSKLYNLAKQIGETISETFKEAFGDDITGKITSIIDKFSNFTDKLNISDDTLADIHDIFKAIFQVLRVGWNLIKNVGSYLGSFVGPILNIIVKALGGIGRLISEFVESDTFASLSNLFDSLKKKLEPLKNLFNNTAEAVSNFFGAFGKKSTEDSEKGLSLFEKFYQIIEKTFGVLKNVVVKVFNGLTDALSEMNFGDIYDIINAFITGRFLTNLTWTVTFISDLEGVLWSLQKNLRSQQLANIAKSILMISGAIFVLSLIKPERLIAPMIALHLLLAELKNISNSFTVGSMTGKKGLFGFLESFSNATQKTINASVFVVLASSILVLSLALKVLSSIDTKDLYSSVIAIGLLLAMLNKFAKEYSGKSINSAGLLGLASSMVVLSIAMRILAKLTIGEIVKGLVSITGLLFIIQNTIDPEKNKGMLGSSIAILIISNALLVLSGVMHILARLTWEGIAKGLLSIVLSMSAMAAIAESMKDAVAGAAAMLIMVTAVMLLVPAFVALGAMKFKNIVKALIAIAGAFVILGVAGKYLKGTETTLLSISGALLLFGLGISAIAIGITLFATSIVALSTSIITNIGSIILSIKLFFTGLLGAIPEIVKFLVTAVVGLIDSLLSAITTLLPKLIETAHLILDGLFVLVPDIIKLALMLLVAFVAGIEQNIQVIANGAISIVTKLVDTIAERMPDIIQSGFNLVLNFVNGIANGVRENEQAIKDAISNVLSSIGEFIIGWIADLVRNIPAVGELIAAPLDDLKKTLRESNAPKIVEGITEGIDDNLPKVEEKGEEIKENTISGISGTGADSLVNIAKGLGKDGLLGFAEGWTDPAAMKTLEKNITKVAKKPENIVSTIQDSHSPSREMAKLGRFSVEGFALGLHDSLRLVTSASTEVGKESLRSLNAAISKSGAIFNDGRGEITPVIRPVVDLTNVARGEKQINSMLTDNPMYDLVSSRGMSLSSSINIQNGNVGVVGAINDLQNKFDSLLDGIRGMNVVMDSGALVGSISNDMDKALGTISTYKGRGNA